jgi:hypothetical protein
MRAALNDIAPLKKWCKFASSIIEKDVKLIAAKQRLDANFVTIVTRVPIDRNGLQ